ncbi:MAG: hypothetical protein JSR54_03535 [Proteobacteria bacterium]|nr:hypothetical protein [Pseudomonadota bacterium]
MKTLILSWVVALIASVYCGTSAAAVEALPRDLEIRLALSSLPQHLQEQATVYVLDPAKGFVVARRGSNGFHALVARTGDDAFRGSWPLTRYRDDILYPVSWDAAGAKAQLQVFLDAAALQAQGMPPDELKKLIQARFTSGYYQPPARAGVSYMLAPILRTYVDPDHTDQVATSNIPHVMHYAPNLTNEDVGGTLPTAEQFGYYSQHGRWPSSPDPFVILHGAHGYFIQFVGVAERDAINRQYADMLTQLCHIKSAWCLPE